MLRGLLAAEGSKVGRRHVTTLMRRMGIEAIYRRPNTSKPAPGHRILSVSAARIDDQSAEPGLGERHQLHPDGARLRLSHCRDGLVHTTHPGLATVEHDGGFVLDRCCRGSPCKTRLPANLQHRLGSQFTSTEFTSVLINNAISISMDGKGAWRDNVFVERFRRTIKYEEVYLRAYDGVEEARQSIGRYIAFYNARRPHAALDGRTPDQAYSHPLPLRTAA